MTNLYNSQEKTSLQLIRRRDNGESRRFASRKTRLRAFRQLTRKFHPVLSVSPGPFRYPPSPGRKLIGNELTKKVMGMTVLDIARMKTETERVLMDSVGGRPGFLDSQPSGHDQAP